MFILQAMSQNLLNMLLEIRFFIFLKKLEFLDLFPGAHVSSNINHTVLRMILLNNFIRSRLNVIKMFLILYQAFALGQ